MQLSEVAQMIGARLRGEDASFTHVSKDSRSIESGALYIAIVGENFDGHDFLDEVSAAGAAGAMVSRESDNELPQLVVEDTVQALGHLAAAWRKLSDVKMIGLTGSNGKTTVKEMCRHVLCEVAGEEAVLATQGNYNNDIGMPLTLLRLREQHSYAVIEMGANHVGEIEYLVNISRPDVALLNNAGPAHLEGFGSLDNVARAKAEIYGGLGEDGVAIINLDDKYAPMWQRMCAERNSMSFSTSMSIADVYCEQGDQVVVHHAGESAVLELKVPGAHNLANAMAATASLLAIGIGFQSVIAALNTFTNIAGRLKLKQLANGLRVIDDSYNANPASVRAGIDVLSQQEGSKVLVLGDMGELGEDAAALHLEIGRYAADKGVDHLFACGEFAEQMAAGFGEGARRFDDALAAIEPLISEIDETAVVLIKGSRFMKMERIVTALQELELDATGQEID